MAGEEERWLGVQVMQASFRLRVCDLEQVPSPLCTSVSTAVKQDNYSSYHIDMLWGLNVLIHVERSAQRLAYGPAPPVSAMV